jgi:phenylalanyl-tRNA synthetase alpha chain
MSETSTPELDVAAIGERGAAAIAGAASTAELAQVETDLLGKRSVMAAAHRSLGHLDEGERKEAGRRLGELRTTLEAQLSSRRAELEQEERAAFLIADRLDLTEVIPSDVRAPLMRGHLHLTSQARDELEDLFVGMGFTVAEGPEAESDWYNFEALNFPPGHPARAMHDTMYLDIGEPETVVLRTHTSPVQIHLMEEAVRNGTLPIHAVMPGKCYRLDTPDATHLSVFNQIEGLVVDRGITFGDLAGTIQTFTEAYFGPGMQSRLRPAYFPFTEPSAEFEITCAICRGEGCRTCSGTGWIELGGCGMVDPAVFAAVGIDSDEWSGFAFGFGIERMPLMRYAIPDMRSFIENDIRFLSQF